MSVLRIGPDRTETEPRLSIPGKAPELPPLADPELFKVVFFRKFSSGDTNFIPHYGDVLLKAMTFDVLSELFGRNNFKIVEFIE